MNKRIYALLMLIGAIVLLIIGINILNDKNDENDENLNGSIEEKVVYIIEDEHYAKQIEFTFKNNQAKFAVITEKYNDRNLYEANVIMLIQDDRFTNFKEDGNVVTYTYTEDGFKDLLNNDKESITSTMELIGYKLSK